MKKSDEISKSIQESLNNNININVCQILDDGIAYDNSDSIIEGIVALIKDIDNDKVLLLSRDGNTNKEETIENLFHCFVLALVEIDPIDFEGNDPLDVRMLMETTADYIFDGIKQKQIHGIKLMK